MTTLRDEDRREALANWPDSEDLLSERAAAVWGVWDDAGSRSVRDAFDEIDSSLEEGDTVQTPDDASATSKWRMVRSLVVHQARPPGGGVPALSDEEVQALHKQDVVADLQPTDTASLARQLEEMANELKEAKSAIAALVQRDEADDSADVTSGYEVCDEILSVVPRSYLDIPPLSTKERRRIIRDHGGKYPVGSWPNSLVLKDSTKLNKDVQNAKKISLTVYSQEMSKSMDKNRTTIQMVGTAWSRALEMRAEIEDLVHEDPEVNFRGDDLVTQLSIFEDCLSAAFRLGLDHTAHLRLNVSTKLDAAMGIDHLRVDPRKRATDDFLTPDTAKIVEAEAKVKQNLSWAKKGIFPGSQIGHPNPRTRFSSNPRQNSSGGGNTSGKGRGRGRGRGGRGRGKGGKGKGGGKEQGSSDNSGD